MSLFEALKTAVILELISFERYLKINEDSPASEIYGGREAPLTFVDGKL